jgi:hypothetical protein
MGGAATRRARAGALDQGTQPRPALGPGGRFGTLEGGGGALEQGPGEVVQRCPPGLERRRPGPGALDQRTRAPLARASRRAPPRPETPPRTAGQWGSGGADSERAHGPGGASFDSGVV